MSEQSQRQELHRKIWSIADDVRGAVDGWDFKQYILGILFYRFISENFTSYIEGGDPDINYAEYPEDMITDDIKDDAVKTKGYFIYPSQLFANVVKSARTNEDLNTHLKEIFDEIESSAVGYASENDIKGLFDDVDTRSNRLGNTVPERNKRLADILEGIASLDFGNFEDNKIDLFGDAYEYLISNYASKAGKSGGEFFTPQNVSKLLARIVMLGKDEKNKINKIYDPACGSGSLLLQAKKQFTDHIIEDGFYGQEINMTTYNLARMNMFLHNINYDKFSIERGDTLLDPKHGNEKPFDAIVSNPPYSIKWVGSDDPTLINDDRFAPAGVLAPKSKADFAFIMHSLSYLSSKGRAAIVTFPGIFYRGGAEKKIRQYLVDGNFVEAVIQLPDNLFYGTSIATCILILAKNKMTTDTLFIDASKEFKKETNNNVLTEENLERILQGFADAKDIPNFVSVVPYEKIVEQDYTLSVSTYVEKKDTREKIDIVKLNQEISDTVKNIDRLRAEIDKIVEELNNV
ncbi:type I restriction-modification system subunit M [Streptococcus macedonicus]|uniref:type I restriction-modification system subunit M n=1 Tax=Streptococcus macedonicus TaxID=59310 RepID=UPI001896CCB6|nr:type I restriction-modification system subunit M [Streptococcus macedonicus]MBF6977142.1 type I restriction-modification system subunit M [Streptococcus macedonicus]